jgi:hypothetical protein
LEWLHILSWIMVALGLASSLAIVLDLRRRQPQPMTIMNLVWPINALWGGPVILYAYWKIGRTKAAGTQARAMSMGGALASAAGSATMGERRMEKERPFWQSIVAGTLHCGAGCSLADLVGPFVFRALPFVIAGSMVFCEWTLDYGLALLVGVIFQYAALSPMLGQSGLPIWWRALKVDFLSLTAWQVGMYGWMALVIFVWFGRIEPSHVEFWFLMQVAMACGFVTAFPMNWWLVRAGIKTAM